MTKELKIGDKIICVKKIPHSKILTPGKIYTIRSISYIDDVDCIISLDEICYEKHGAFTLSKWFEPYTRLDKILKIKQRICQEKKINISEK